LNEFYLNVTNNVLATFFNKEEKQDFFSQNQKAIAQHIQDILPGIISLEWIAWLNRYRCDLGIEYPFLDYVIPALKQNFALFKSERVLEATHMNNSFIFLSPNMPFKVKLFHIINSKVFLIDENMKKEPASFSHLRLFLMKEIKRYRIDAIMKILETKVQTLISATEAYNTENKSDMVMQTIKQGGDFES